jgi:predicted nucleotidyltransferase
MAFTTNISVTNDAIRQLCDRWKIERLSLFGSVLRDDFGPQSDVDILVSFQADSEWSLWDWIEMKEEMQTLFGRDVDVFEESGLTNPFRRRRILETREVIYGG